MKLQNIAAVCAVALCAIALLVLAPLAQAQHVIDPSIVQPGAVELQAPMPAAGAEYSGVPDGQVVLPWGVWFGSVLDYFFAALAAGALWLLRKVPSRFVDALNMVSGLMGQGRVDSLLEKAITYGINATKGATQDKVLTVNVGNEVLERAFEYAVRHAPALVSRVGGLQTIREKIIARLRLEADAAVPVPRPPATEGLVVEHVSPPPASAPAPAA